MRLGSVSQKTHTIFVDTGWLHKLAVSDTTYPFREKKEMGEELVACFSQISLF